MGQSVLLRNEGRVRSYSRLRISTFVEINCCSAPIVHRCKYLENFSVFVIISITALSHVTPTCTGHTAKATPVTAQLPCNSQF